MTEQDALIAEARAAFRASPGYELGVQPGSAIDLVRRLADALEQALSSSERTDAND